MLNKVFDIGRAFSAGARYAVLVALDDFWITKKKKDGEKYPVLIDGEPSDEFKQKYGKAGQSRWKKERNKKIKSDQKRQDELNKELEKDYKKRGSLTYEEQTSMLKKYKGKIDSLGLSVNETGSYDIPLKVNGKENRIRLFLSEDATPEELYNKAVAMKELAENHARNGTLTAWKKAEYFKAKGITENIDRLYPDSIAGVDWDYPMTFTEADGGRVNPKFNAPRVAGETQTEYKRRMKGWWNNCQTCVPAFEMRMRGYNLEATNATGATSSWGKDYGASAWVDPDTGKTPQTTIAKNKKGLFASRNSDLISHLDISIKDGERHCLYIPYKKNRAAHVIVVMKKGGNLVMYDPQSGKTATPDQFSKAYSGKISYSFFKGYPVHWRIDNLELNPQDRDKNLKQ